MFMDYMGYANQVGLMSEEISSGGEGLGVCTRSTNSSDHRQL